MRRGNSMIWFAAISGMAVLILDSKTAMYGAATGMDLCIKTVIPAVFPFLFLSNLILQSGTHADWLLLRFGAKAFGIPNEAKNIMIPAFLGGYSAGAKSVASACSTGMLSSKSSERKLAYCNQAGPAFLFGMVASQFERPYTIWTLWGIQIISAWMVSGFFSCEIELSGEKKEQMTQNTAFEDALHAIGMICGWIILFRILIEFLHRWALWYMPVSIQVFLTGCIELSNGCCLLRLIPDENTRFVVCSGMLSWGGLCILMQTMSIVKPLRIRYYMLGKAFQTILSLGLAWAMIQKHYLLVLAVLGGCYWIQKNWKLQLSCRTLWI